MTASYDPDEVRRVLRAESDAELALRLERARRYVEFSRRGARHFLVSAQVTVAVEKLEHAYREARTEAQVMRYALGRPDPTDGEVDRG